LFIFKYPSGLKSGTLGHKVFLFTNKVPDCPNFILQLLSIFQFIGVNTEAKKPKFNFSVLNLKRKSKTKAKIKHQPHY
jgi:hypothetical protein